MSNLTLPLLDDPCSVILSTDVWMWAKGLILEGGRCTCTSRYASSRSLIIMSFLGVLSDISLSCVSLEKGEQQKTTGPPGPQEPLLGWVGQAGSPLVISCLGPHPIRCLTLALTGGSSFNTAADSGWPVKSQLHCIYLPFSPSGRWL